MPSTSKHKTFSSALISAKIVRRQILDQIVTLIKKEEDSPRSASVLWSDVGSIERQHDYLCRILAELKKSPDT